jgi:hypothetical protein
MKELNLGSIVFLVIIKLFAIPGLMDTLLSCFLDYRVTSFYAL